MGNRSALDIGEDLRLSILDEDDPVVARGLDEDVARPHRASLDVFAFLITHHDRVSRECGHRLRQCRKRQQREQEDIEIAFHFILLSCSMRQKMEQNHRWYFSSILRCGSFLPQMAHL